MNKTYLVSLGVCIAITAFAYFIFFSPMLMAIGCLLSLYTIICLIHNIVTKTDKLAENTGCLVAMAVVATLLIATFTGDHFHISEYGDLRHLYTDCQKKKGTDDYYVCKLSAIIWGCYSDCETCKSRHEKEKKQKRIERKERRKKQDIEFIENQIQELNNVKQEILDGKRVDVSEYEFVKDADIESDDDDTYIHGVPSRYQ